MEKSITYVIIKNNNNCKMYAFIERKKTYETDEHKVMRLNKLYVQGVLF